MVAVELAAADAQLAGGGSRIQRLAVAIVQQAIAAPVQRIGRDVGAGAQRVHRIEQGLLEGKGALFGGRVAGSGQLVEGVVAQVHDVMEMPEGILELIGEAFSGRRHGAPQATESRLGPL